MRNTVSWIFDLQLQAGRDAEWRALMEEMIAATQASEPGTIGYEWSVTDDGVRWQIHETFADAAAAAIHSATFSRQFAKRFFGCVAPTRIVVYGTPTDDVRAALAPLNPQYMGSVAGFTR